MAVGKAGRRPPPTEYINYILLDYFRCLPSELENQDHAKISEFLWVRNIVLEAQEEERKSLERARKPY